jgi:hypothetical protein
MNGEKIVDEKTKENGGEEGRQRTRRTADGKGEWRRIAEDD